MPGLSRPVHRDDPNPDARDQARPAHLDRRDVSGADIEQGDLLGRDGAISGAHAEDGVEYGAVRSAVNAQGERSRQAAALVASAIANGLMPEPGARIPRRMVAEETDLVIENGVGRDILSSGMATLVPGYAEGSEIFRLSSAGHDHVLGEIGRARLIDAGVVDPDAEGAIDQRIERR